MFDRRRRRALPPTRREHWHVVIVVVVVLLVFLLVGEIVNEVVKSSSGVDQRTDRTWAAGVAAIVDDSNATVSTLHAIRAHATDRTEFDRVTLELALERLERSAERDARAYNSLDLAAPTARADALVAGVFNLRLAGAENLARGVELAISRPGGTSTIPEAGQLLETAGSRFLAADAGYRALLAALRGDAATRSLPSSVWVLSPGVWSASAAVVWASELRVAPSLVFAPALSIVAVTLVPPPLDITGLPTTTTTTTTTSTTLATTTTTLPVMTTLPGTATTGAGPGHARRHATSTTSSTTTSVVAPTASTSPARARPTTTTSTLPATTTTLQIPPAGSVSVVAATRQLEIVVIVENTGDTTARGADVTAVLTPTPSSHTGAARVSAGHKLATFAPGVSQYVVMPKLAVRRGTGYELVVTASVPAGPTARRSIGIYVSR